VNQGMIRAPSYREREDGPYLAPDEIEQRDGVPIVKATGRPAYSVVEKMSKSKKNVINPDGLVEEVGADVLRLYILFMGPPEADKVWSRSDIEGVRRFVNRAWRLVAGDERFSPAPRTDAAPEGDLARLLHATVAGVTADMESRSYNTAISKLMILLNGLHQHAAGADGEPSRPVPSAALDAFVRMLAPFAPHVAEELWSHLGGKGLVAHATWPTFDPARLEAAQVELAVQVDGKVRDRFRVAADAPEDEVLERAKALPAVQRHLEGRRLMKELVVPGRLVVIVTA
jgi:leucyl-tRNA synthetase